MREFHSERNEEKGGRGGLKIMYSRLSAAHLTSSQLDVRLA